MTWPTLFIASFLYLTSHALRVVRLQYILLETRPKTIDIALAHVTGSIVGAGSLLVGEIVKIILLVRSVRTPASFPILGVVYSRILDLSALSLFLAFLQFGGRSYDGRLAFLVYFGTASLLIVLWSANSLLYSLVRFFVRGVHTRTMFRLAEACETLRSSTSRLGLVRIERFQLLFALTLCIWLAEVAAVALGSGLLQRHGAADALFTTLDNIVASSVLVIRRAAPAAVYNTFYGALALSGLGLVSIALLRRRSIVSERPSSSDHSGSGSSTRIVVAGQLP